MKVLEVKKSEVDPVVESGLGLFACCDFEEGGIVTIYLGEVVDKDVESIYSMSNGRQIIDARPWCEGVSHLGAHMANDPTLKEDGEDDRLEYNASEEKEEPNINVGAQFEFIASKSIKAGDEITYNHNLIMN